MVRFSPLALFLALVVAGPATARADHRRPRGDKQENARSTTTDLRRSAPVEHARGRIKNNAPPGATELDRSLQRELDRILGDSTLKSSINGVYLVDGKSGKVLYAYGEDRQIDPASNTKLISTATALDALGPDYSYRTRLVGPAPDADGVVDGDVWLVGSGDPLLDVDDLMDLANELRSSGVRKITGDVIIGSDGERDGLAHATLEVAVRGGDQEGAPVEVALHPDTGMFVVEVSARTSASRRGKLEVSLDAVKRNGQPRIRVSVTGRIHPDQVVELERTVPKNLLFTAQTVRAYALLAGVDMTGGVRQVDSRRPEGAGSVELAAHRSVPLSRLAALINKPSNNYLADRLITTVGVELYGGDASMAKGVKAMSAWLDKIGISAGSYRLENGSGLSHTIHVSARQIAQVLLSGARDDRYGTVWVDSFAVGGQDGTLARRFSGRPSAGFVRGKTGTLDGVATLSGFVYAPEGSDDTICFSILSEGFRDGKKRQIRAGQADMVDAIFRYLAARRAGGNEVAPPAPAPDVPDGQDSEDL